MKGRGRSDRRRRKALLNRAQHSNFENTWANCIFYCVDIQHATGSPIAAGLATHPPENLLYAAHLAAETFVAQTYLIPLQDLLGLIGAGEIGGESLVLLLTFALVDVGCHHLDVCQLFLG